MTMPDLPEHPPEHPVESRPDARQYLIGNLDPAATAQVDAALGADPQVRVVPSPVSDLITVEAAPDYAAKLKAQLTAQFPEVIFEENAPLEPLGTPATP